MNTKRILKLSLLSISKITYRLWGTKDGISLYEVYVIENTKGNAINMIIDMFRVNRDFTIAFGDDLNDFDMLQTVGHGVSMLNARNGLKSATKYQTYLTNQDDGIVDYLEKVFNFKLRFIRKNLRKGLN